jgi:hypothetical protein
MSGRWVPMPTVKMEAVCFSKVVVPTYQIAWCHNAGAHNMIPNDLKKHNSLSGCGLHWGTVPTFAWTEKNYTHTQDS